MRASLLVQAVAVCVRRDYGKFEMHQTDVIKYHPFAVGRSCDLCRTGLLHASIDDHGNLRMGGTVDESPHRFSPPYPGSPKTAPLATHWTSPDVLLLERAAPSIPHLFTRAFDGSVLTDKQHATLPNADSNCCLWTAPSGETFPLRGWGLVRDPDGGVNACGMLARASRRVCCRAQVSQASPKTHLYRRASVTCTAYSASARGPLEMRTCDIGITVKNRRGSACGSP